MLLDQLDRPLRNLRLSVTDRCNLRCQYCMPEMEYVWLPREDMLHFEEINRLVDVFMSLGVNHIRLTGGEPLLRRDLSTLVDMLAAKEGLKDLALTSNGILLADVRCHRCRPRTGRADRRHGRGARTTRLRRTLPAFRLARLHAPDAPASIATRATVRDDREASLMAARAGGKIVLFSGNVKNNF